MSHASDGRGFRLRFLLLILLLVIAAGVGGALAFAWRRAIPPASPPPRVLTPSAIRHGAQLAALGDCTSCHTRDHLFAGGVPVPTPFGTVYASNITPDPTTGIGTWSEAAFRRAMRQGVDRHGHYLYPAFPYDHFTHATDGDLHDLYAFLMTRPPVHAVAPRNSLGFPFNQRILLAGWDWLFLHPGPMSLDAAHDAPWNRGAYLAEGLGHCGACHTPRNRLGAERRGESFAGSNVEAWYAPPLNAASPAGVAWTVDEMTTYLRGGVAPHHGTPDGPMRTVAQDLAQVPKQDAQAIATYVVNQMQHAKPPAPADRAAETATMPGAAIFAGACGNCHAADALMTRAGAPPIGQPSPVHEATPRNVIQIVLNGLPWRDATPQAYMPGFAAALTDRQLADLLAYLRARFTTQPAWTDLDDTIHRIRQHGGEP